MEGHQTSRRDVANDPVSVVIPALDEEEGISATVGEVVRVLTDAGIVHEVLVVDDGSTDATAARARQAGATVFSHPENRGYGAAIKSGVARAANDLVVILDADGTYPAEALPELIGFAGQYDMVVGARTGADVHIPGLRRPAKWFLGRLAGYLAGRRIPDLNSGMRVMHRWLVERFSHVLPDGFSFTTSITLAALCSGSPVRYQPIDYRPRVGKSKLRALHTVDFLLLVLRSIVYFNPLRVFLPIGAILFLLGSGKLVYDLFQANISDSAVVCFLGAAIVWSFGLLSDQIARTGARTWMR
jgi:glycosyltransferase involved in cell wall biosynthesis